MQQLREVYSLLMPLADGRVVVPRAAVAEVLGFLRPRDRPDNAPDFLLGFIDWQGQRIPLVSLEAARGHGVPELGRRTRIAVVFGFGGQLQPDVFALVTQGYPYLVRVNENVLQPEPMEEDEPFVLARVRMANEKPLIPDLEGLEERLVAALAAAGTATVEETPAEPDVLEGLAGEEDDFTADILSDEAGDQSAEMLSTDDAVSPQVDAAVQESEAKTGEEADEISGEAGLELDVTGFGGETDYSAELDELASALDDTATGAELEFSALDEPGEDDEITLEGFEIETDEDVPEIDLSGLAVDEASAGGEDEEIEFDLSDLELLDDDERKPD